jgi:hypothetical protein
MPANAGFLTSHLADASFNLSPTTRQAHGLKEKKIQHDY